jgi:hypothetical protein
MIDGDSGSFTMQLNKSELASLQNGKRLLIVLKPFRTPIELYYDISDFKEMHLALNNRALHTEAKAASEKEDARKKAAQAMKTKKKCKVSPPVKYKNINPVEYNCDDIAGKKAAESRLNGMVKKEREKEKKLAAEREKQRQLAEQQRQKELAEKMRREELLRAEAAAIAASEEKQAKLGNEIAQKMIKVCEKFWVKGEHRCYCQKYIEFAPAEVQARAECN